MKLHEYQAKALMRERGIPVPEGQVARTGEEAQAAALALGGGRLMLKAQVHAGGRGKAGGVLACETPEQLRREAERLLGSTLVTHQTGPVGLPVEQLLIETPTAIAREIYLGLLVDRETRRLTFIASAEGGMEIERLAVEEPDKILTSAVSPSMGLMPYQARHLGFALGLDAEQCKALDRLLRDLYRLFIDTDASLIELNPLVVTDSGALIALDAKIELDDSGLFRHPELAELRDPGQSDPRELAAAAHQLNYISLDGDIGCMVNGAGLAMATMDLVKLHGGTPANFLDVGGGTTAARVAEAFKLILSDDKVRAVLVNIFGGIVRCDLIAEGIIQAVREVKIQVPLVVRLEGTRAPEGLALLAESGLALQTATSLTEAAQLVVAAAKA